jgi:hypothetical protein
LHNKLVKEGVNPQSDDYYEKIDSRMRQIFPDQFEDVGEEVGQRRRRTNVVAPQRGAQRLRKLGYQQHNLYSLTFRSYTRTIRQAGCYRHEETIMAQNRIDRELTTREKTVRKKGWSRPEVLPSPTPEDGYAFKWVRISTQGQVDATNVSSKLREGWEPVRAEDHPEITMVAVENERFKDNVVIGGLMLCKAPSELPEERNEHYENQNNAQILSVDNSLMRENDPRMPLFNERKTKVTFGKGI